jgi:AcrR family transcriptional regulator
MDEPAETTARRLPRAQRREQILVSATEAFARSGYAATSLEDVAREAGVTRMIVYTHFESKTVLYRSVLERMREKLGAATGAPEFGPSALDAVLKVAAADPAGFRLLFHHAGREPEFRASIDEIRAAGIDVARRFIAARIPDPAWAEWACTLIPTVVLEGVIAWLDAGQPDPEAAAARIRTAVGGIVSAAGGADR